LRFFFLEVKKTVEAQNREPLRFLYKISYDKMSATILARCLLIVPAFFFIIKKEKLSLDKLLEIK